MTKGLPDDWVSTCMICDGDFAVRLEESPENPSKSGTFCPDCRARGRIAPGVLHWRPRHKADDEPAITSIQDEREMHQ
jgi:hypothetical protein